MNMYNTRVWQNWGCAERAARLCHLEHCISTTDDDHRGTVHNTVAPSSKVLTPSVLGVSRKHFEGRFK